MERDIDEIVRKDLVEFLGALVTDRTLIGEDHLDTPVLIGALITVIKAYSKPAQRADLVELMKAAP